MHFSIFSSYFRVICISFTLDLASLELLTTSLKPKRFSFNSKHFQFELVISFCFLNSFFSFSLSYSFFFFCLQNSFCYNSAQTHFGIIFTVIFVFNDYILNFYSSTITFLILLLYPVLLPVQLNLFLALPQERHGERISVAKSKMIITYNQTG